MTPTLYLGAHKPYFLKQTTARLFVSRRQFLREDGTPRERLPRALGPWALDSGGFTEIEQHGGWNLRPEHYALFVLRCRDEIGGLEWAAPQDWMCEPHMLERTGLDVAEHQARTVRNFVELRQLLGAMVVPVVQGWTLDDYLRCVKLYERAGVELEREPLVGVGTVCRRQDTREAALIVRALAGLGLRLHGFGVKIGGLEGRYAYWDALASFDSLAWSYNARKRAQAGEPSCDPTKRKACNNCLHYALEWRESLLPRLDPDQQLLWKEAAPCVV